LFAMPAAFVAPDLIVAELVKPDGPALLRQGLRQESLPGEAVAEVVRITEEDRHISVQDASALVLAQRSGRVLLTGEKRLRELARRNGVAVHGTLWLLEQMVRARVLTSGRAADALEKMLAEGCRLPETETRNLLRHLRAGKETD